MLDAFQRSTCGRFPSFEKVGFVSHGIGKKNGTHDCLGAIIWEVIGI
jgi:hypothetical protein